jgi:hypothetical protein
LWGATIFRARQAGGFAAWQATKSDGLPHGKQSYQLLEQVCGKGALYY